MGYTVSSSEDGSSGGVYSRVLTPNPVTRTDTSLEDGAERGVPTGLECSDGTACPTSPMVKFDDQRGEVAGKMMMNAGAWQFQMQMILVNEWDIEGVFDIG